MDKHTSLPAKVVGILLSLLMLLLMEAAARFVFPRGDRLETILDVLKEDPVLVWRLRENLHVRFQDAQVDTNSRGLRNAEIAPQKKPETYRIVCLGDSLTFGWGVSEDESYPRQLEKLLNRRLALAGRVEVINAGVIGYSSFQGLRFFEREIVPLAPDIITVPFVVNDVDKYRFFRSDGSGDRELEPRPAAVTAVANFLARSRLYRFMVWVLRDSRLPSIPGGDMLPTYSDKARVTADEYDGNLRAIVDAARQHNIQVVFIKMPVNLPLPPAVSATAALEADQLADQALAFGRTGKYDEALRRLEQAAARDPYSGKIPFYQAYFYRRAGDRDAARRSIEALAAIDAMSCGQRGKVYNRVMETAARERQVPLVDIVDVFAERGRDGVSLFRDPRLDRYHPNAEGHRLIARETARVLIDSGLLRR